MAAIIVMGTLLLAEKVEKKLQAKKQKKRRQAFEAAQSGSSAAAAGAAGWTQSWNVNAEFDDDDDYHKDHKGDDGLNELRHLEDPPPPCEERNGLGMGRRGDAI